MNSPATSLTARTDQTPLDEVMLAMDIVDTLRHERSTVERELDADMRDTALVERIKQIYSGQGIAVTDDLIRKGVEALKQDRFTYVSPRPSFSLRLAHVYVERWKWFRRTAIGAVLISGGYVAMQLPQQWQDSRAYAAYADRVEGLSERVGKLDLRIDRLARWNAAQSLADEPARAAVARSVDEIDAALKRVRAQRASLAALTPVASDVYLNQVQTSEVAVERGSAELVEIETTLGTLDEKSNHADRLIALSARYGAAATVLAGAALKPGDVAATEEVRRQAEAALRAGDAALAETSVRRLDQIATQLSQAYELRIVSQSGVKSGVWRYPVDNPNSKNFYLVVEAISESGVPLTLPITNEETQKIEDVSRFALRVPESVYEAVKADKIDNGLVDNALVGSKRRGELEVEFTMPIAGGYITRWDD